MGDMPRYEDLKVHIPSGGYGMLQRALHAMGPGQIVTARSIWNREITANYASSTVSRINAEIGRREFISRTRNGVVYIVRLNPEDIKARRSR